MMLNLLILASMAAYSLFIFRLLKRHRQKIGDYFSVVSLGTTVTWLNWITVSFIGSYLLVAILSLLKMPNLWVPDLGTDLFIVAFSFAVLKQPELFNTPENDKTDEKRYAKSGLKKGLIKDIIPRLEEVMKTEKLFLDPELTIVDLAEKLDIPRHHLTQILNEVYKRNFYQFINEYRISEVKLRIDQGEARRYSLLGLSLDCGFNSKSAFNLTFKNLVGCTPSEYRKRVLP